MLLGGLRGGAAHVARMVVGILLLALVVIAAGWGLAIIGNGEPHRVLSMFIGASIVCGFVVAPLVTSAADPLDPRRFAVLDLPVASLAGALTLAGAISIPVLAVLALVIVDRSSTSPTGGGLVAAILSVILVLWTCVLCARVSEAVAALVLRERRSRELSVLFLLALLIVVAPVSVFFSSLKWGSEVPTQIVHAADALAVTPIGAAWALPWVWGTAYAWQTLLVAILTVIVLAGVWMLLVKRLLTVTERPASVRGLGGLGWFGVAPGTPTGAVAARSLTYWLRDRRYLANILVIPVAALIIVVPPLVAGVPLASVALLPVPLIALFLGWLPHNDVAYDSSALWMHISSGLRGVADRVGRLVPVILVGTPILAIAVPIAVSFHGRWLMLPAMVGVVTALFLSGLGFSSIASVLAPYSVSPAGESLFQQPQRTTSSGVASQGLVMLGTLVVSAPTLWSATLNATGVSDAFDRTMWWGIVTGVVVCVLGVALGSAVFNKQSGRLMEFAELA